MKSEIDKSTRSNFAISFEPKNKIMQVDFSGIVDLKDIIDSLSTVVRHQEFEVNMPACYDFTQATLDIDISDTEIIFHFLSGMLERRGDSYHLALVFSDLVTKTILEYYRLHFSRTKVDIELFPNVDAALDWIILSQNEAEIVYLNRDQ